MTPCKTCPSKMKCKKAGKCMKKSRAKPVRGSRTMTNRKSKKY